MKAQDALSLIRLIDEATPLRTSFVESRTILLAKLNSIIKMMNDEEAYMTWIYLVPDEADWSDFNDIAEDDKMFEEVLEAFIRIFSNYKYAE